jgi:hypothetical protein
MYVCTHIHTCYVLTNPPITYVCIGATDDAILLHKALFDKRTSIAALSSAQRLRYFFLKNKYPIYVLFYMCYSVVLILVFAIASQEEFTPSGSCLTFFFFFFFCSFCFCFSFSGRITRSGSARVPMESLLVCVCVCARERVCLCVRVCVLWRV